MTGRYVAAAFLLLFLPGMAGPGSDSSGGIAVPWGPAPLGAQVGIGLECQLRPDYRELTSRQVSPGNRVTYVGRPFLICPDGLTIQADSAVVYEAAGRSELIGNVRFRHPERHLDARMADYFERDGRLYARGNVRFLDVERGTEIEGDTLDYREARAGRPEDQLTVWGDRSVAIFAPAAPEGAESDPVPYRVVADRLRFEGDRYFWGDGDVEVEREDLRAASDSLTYDQVGGQLILTGNADVVRGEMTATGGIINLAIREDRLESLRTRRDGRIETAQGEVLTGEEVLVRLTPDEEVESVFAEGTAEARATLVSEELRLDGVTIRIENEPDQDRVIRATGQARAETAARPAPIPLPADDTPGFMGAMLDRDWIEGDEIIAHFVETGEVPEGPGAAVSDPADPDDPAQPAPAEALDGAADRRDAYRLEWLESTGNARTLYRQPPGPESREVPGADRDDDWDADAEDELVVDAATGQVLGDDGPCPWAVSYVLADRIVIHMLDGEVDRVEAEGDRIDGIQLDPICHDPGEDPDAPPGGSLDGADSASGPGNVDAPQTPATREGFA